MKLIFLLVLSILYVINKDFEKRVEWENVTKIVTTQDRFTGPDGKTEFYYNWIFSCKAVYWFVSKGGESVRIRDWSYNKEKKKIKITFYGNHFAK
jgi:hypothetical protein